VSGFVARARRVPSWQVALGLALLTLGFLMAVQFRAQAPITRYSSSELPPLRQTAQQLQDTQERLRDQIKSLRDQIAAAEQNAAGNSTLVGQLNDQLQQARLAAGLVELQGPGLVLNVDDSTQPVSPDAAPGDYLVSAGDLRDLLAQLWLSGAEAISVNGERIGPTTALTDIGPSILVNSAYLQPPYQISAIGPADLYDRLTSSAGFVGFVRSRVQGVGIQLGILRSDSVVVSAFTGPVSLVFAQPLPTASTPPSGVQP
jgi:uncharacterized protein YlxW (UPF0749 family)